ncbi:multicopper oxidase family protein [Hamadaea sp. NPDC050747]|uniref:multicopper oxidase family protein n=1 Tax=Hamadaea sp. NPDC050747 TaxID=3155789 RepID=UPI0033F190E2
MVTRRVLLAAGLTAAGGGLGGCLPGGSTAVVSPTGPQVAAAEQARRPGPERGVAIDAIESEVDLGGVIVPAWSYGGRLARPVIRLRAGEQLVATVRNRLPAETSVHWHGITLRNDADGVPHVTQEPIQAGGEFVYRFTAPAPGTYWFHPHSGLQLERGLSAPLIVDDPHEPLAYDHEWIVVLDDWLDRTPEAVYADLARTGRMMGMGEVMGTVAYAHHLVNGRLPADPDVLRARPGDRIRLRLINAGGDTAYRVALGGHRMTVTHTDGLPIRPIPADTLLIGMGERYDALITAGDGVFPLVASAEGKNGTGLALLRTGGGAPPPAGVLPAELGGLLPAYDQMKADDSVALAGRNAAQTLRTRLTGGMMRFVWGFDGRTFDHDRVDLVVSAGERVWLEIANTTMMWHPVHLHGHSFAVGDVSGPRKDTVGVFPGRTVRLLFDADNPGRWMLHCHNAYHAEAGMMTLLGYRV